MKTTKIDLDHHTKLFIMLYPVSQKQGIVQKESDMVDQKRPLLKTEILILQPMFMQRQQCQYKIKGKEFKKSTKHYKQNHSKQSARTFDTYCVWRLKHTHSMMCSGTLHRFSPSSYWMRNDFPHASDLRAQTLSQSRMTLGPITSTNILTIIGLSSSDIISKM